MVSPPPEIERAIAAQFDCSVSTWDSLTGGRAAQTHHLVLESEPYHAVCKIGGPSVRTGDVIEPLVLELVAETTDLPVPAVLVTGTLSEEGNGAADEEGAFSAGTGTPWAVYEFCEGDRPVPYRELDPAVRINVVEDVGSILGRLHASRAFERTGGLARQGDTLTIREPDGLDFPGRGRAILDRYAGDEVDTRPVLSHGDLYPGNLLIDGEGRITGLVDWGNAHVTTPGYALARAHLRFIDWYHFGPDHRRGLAAALKEGYRAHRALPADYPDRLNVYEVLWLAQSADRVRRHVRTRRGRRRLGQHVSALFSLLLPERGHEGKNRPDR